jgi:type IV secretion system protein VirB4
MEADVQELMADVHSGCVGFGYYTAVFVFMDSNRQKVEEAAARMQQAINALGFVGRIETINTIEAYLGSLPGHGVENVRRPLMTSINLAHFLPMSSMWIGEAKAPCPFYPPQAPALLHAVTEGHTPFYFNLHVGDLAASLMVGKPGAGKSTMLGTLAMSFLRYQNAQVFAFDKGMSLYALTKAIGGQHYVVGGDEDQLAFCPLQFLDTQNDRAFAGEWLDGILALNGVATTPEQRNEIATTLNLMNEHGGDQRTLSDFCSTIQDAAIRSALQQYTVAGAMGYLLDAKTDGLAMGRFLTFEIEDLMNLGEKYSLPVLLYLFRRIEKALKGQPSVILLDECWLMLQHPVFKEKIREWLKTMRKANCAVVMATQSLSDFSRSGIADVVISSTATKIFLPDHAAKEEEARALYQRFGLNEYEIEILAKAITKKQYYVTSAKGRRLIDLALGPLALAFCGVSDKDSVAKVRGFEIRYGNQWVHEYLLSKNLRLEDYL